MTGYCIACNENTKTRFRTGPQFFNTYFPSTLSRSHPWLPLNEEIQSSNPSRTSFYETKKSYARATKSRTPPTSPSKKKKKKKKKRIQSRKTESNPTLCSPTKFFGEFVIKVTEYKAYSGTPRLNWASKNFSGIQSSHII